MKLRLGIILIIFFTSLNAWSGVVSLESKVDCSLGKSLNISLDAENLTTKMNGILGVTPLFCRENKVSTDDINDEKLKTIVDDLIKNEKGVSTVSGNSYIALGIMRSVALKKLWSLASKEVQTKIFFENDCSVSQLNKWPVFSKDEVKDEAKDALVIKNYKQLCSQSLSFENLAPFLSKDVLTESMIILGRIYPTDFKKIKNSICDHFSSTPESILKDDKYGNSVLGVDYIKDSVQFKEWIDTILAYQAKHPSESFEVTIQKLFQTQNRQQAIKEILTPEELTAITKYTGMYYNTVNTCLRSKDECDNDSQAIIKDATAGLQKLAASNHTVTTLFRGAASLPTAVRAKIEAAAITGEATVIDPAFLSTSGDLSVAQIFAGDEKERVLFVIKGKSCIGISEIAKYKNEDEFLCPPGMTFKITKSTVDGVYTLEEMKKTIPGGDYILEK